MNKIKNMKIKKFNIRGLCSTSINKDDFCTLRGYYKIHKYPNAVSDVLPHYKIGLNIFDKSYPVYNNYYDTYRDAFSFYDEDNVFNHPYWQGDYIRIVTVPIDDDYLELEYNSNKFWSNKLILSDPKPLGSVDTIKNLITDNVNITASNNKLLMWEINNKNYDAAQCIIDHLKSKNIDIPFNSILEKCIYQHNLSMVKNICMLDEETFKLEENTNLLILAVSIGNFNAVELLLNLYAKLNIFHIFTDAILELYTIAVSNGNLEMLVLLEKYYDNLHNHVNTLIIISSTKGHIHIVEYLLRTYKKLLANNLDESLYFAALNNHTYVVTCLCRSRANAKIVLDRINNDKATKNIKNDSILLLEYYKSFN